MLDAADAAAAASATTVAAATAAAARAAHDLDVATCCCACMDEPRQMVFYPCRHFLLCAACAEKLQRGAAGSAPPASGTRSSRGTTPQPRCPVCRRVVESIEGPFFVA